MQLCGAERVQPAMTSSARPMVRSIPAIAVLLLLPAFASAKAAFLGKVEMVKQSEAIAVITVEQVEKVEVKGNQWTYGQRATARVVTLLKGELPKEGTFAIHGDE